MSELSSLLAINNGRIGYSFIAELICKQVLAAKQAELVNTLSTFESVR